MCATLLAVIDLRPLAIEALARPCVGRAPRAPRHCEAPGCHRATEGHKPLCSDHVLDMPHVRSVLAGLDERERDAQRPRVEGPWAAEILRALEVEGPQSSARLARHACAGQLDAAQVERLLRALARTGRVVIGAARRNGPIARLR